MRAFKEKLASNNTEQRYASADSELFEQGSVYPDTRLTLQPLPQGVAQFMDKNKR
jgi:hypothetical protein